MDQLPRILKKNNNRAKNKHLPINSSFSPTHRPSQPTPGLHSQLPWRACSTWTAAAGPWERGRTAPCTPRRTSGCPGRSPSPPRYCCSAPALRWSGCGPPWSAPSAHTGCTEARCCSGCTSTCGQDSAQKPPSFLNGHKEERPLTWTCFLRSAHLSQCNATTLSACLQTGAPLGAEKTRDERLKGGVPHMNTTRIPS